MSTIQLKLTKRIFYLLSFDSPVRCFLPKALVPFVDEILKPTFTNDALGKLLLECKKYNPLLGEFIESFASAGCKVDADIISFLACLCKRVNEVATVETPTSSPISGSYNPAKHGRFYYFSEQGSQIRRNRLFKIDNSGNHDDQPTTSNCKKCYPMVAKRGTSFLFLWFCPSHGHCFGAHIVNGSEGRKDAACSLYTHLEIAPDVIFYDFACSLEEYCLNRKADFFKSTRPLGTKRFLSRL